MIIETQFPLVKQWIKNIVTTSLDIARYLYRMPRFGLVFEYCYQMSENKEKEKSDILKLFTKKVKKMGNIFRDNKAIWNQLDNRTWCD